MTTLLQQELAGYLPAKRQTNSKGWQSFNAVCCPHNGESMDKRGRGGIIFNPDGGVSYHCFNCQYKAAYTPGHPLPYKFRKLLDWLGVDDATIHRLVIDALREKERQELLGIIKPEVVKEEVKVNFKKRSLPPESMSFLELVTFYELADSLSYPDNLVKAVEYVDKRKINMQRYNFYVSPDIKFKMDKRVIVPFTWKGDTIGYTARTFVDGVKPKYQTEVDSGYVFNIDKQERDWKFVLVSEGIFDAISVDGVACMGSDITKQQVDLIESLDREIIVVPDWNKSGQKLIDVALANKWSVAFPVWAETCEDINDAVVKYGKLFVMKAILDSVERSSLKIQLKRKQFR
jgi:hypothetical protein